MLAIRMQRTGRSGHAMFRVVVQDARRTPTSGNIVVQLGSYDPHAKATHLDKDKAAFYLEHGAQPSDRVVRLFEAEGVKLPSWVSKERTKQGQLRHPDKLRRNRPQEEAAAVPVAQTEAEPVASEEPAADPKEAEKA